MLFLLGNKSDLENQREVTFESILDFKEHNQILYAQETSAKTGKNVDRLFTDCARFLFDKYRDRMNEIGHNGNLS